MIYSDQRQFLFYLHVVRMLQFCLFDTSIYLYYNDRDNVIVSDCQRTCPDKLYCAREALARRNVIFMFVFNVSYLTQVNTLCPFIYTT